MLWAWLGLGSTTAGVAGAADFNWTGNGTGDTWNEGANWTPVPIFGFDATSDLTLDTGGAPTTLSGDLRVGSIDAEYTDFRNSAGSFFANPSEAFSLTLADGDLRLTNVDQNNINPADTAIWVFDGVDAATPALQIEAGDLDMFTNGPTRVVLNSIPGALFQPARPSIVRIDSGQWNMREDAEVVGNGRIEFGFRLGSSRLLDNNGLLAAGYTGPISLGATPATTLRIEGSGQTFDLGRVDLDGGFETGRFEVRRNATLELPGGLHDAFSGAGLLEDGATLHIGRDWTLDGELGVIGGASATIAGAKLSVEDGGTLAGFDANASLTLNVPLDVNDGGTVQSGGLILSESEVLIASGGTMQLALVQGFGVVEGLAGSFGGPFRVADGGGLNLVSDLETRGSARLENGSATTFPTGGFGISTPPTWTVRGDLAVEQSATIEGFGTLQIAANGSVNFERDGDEPELRFETPWELDVENAGELVLNNTRAGTFFTPGSIDFADAEFMSYTQDAGATLTLEYLRQTVVGPAPIGELAQLRAEEAIELAGTLRIVGDDPSLAGLPEDGETFTFLQSRNGGVTGNFTDLELIDLPGIAAQLTYFADRVDVTFSRLNLPGDFNASGQVEQGDLNLVLNNWGVNTAAAGIPSGWVNTDGLDGAVDQAELNAVLNNWGSTLAPSFAGPAVPEPAAALVWIGGSWLGTRRRAGHRRSR
ncbi:MAG: hypothetical protein AAGE65_00520 [Planctomycetota bacterium]